jgi:hypothetical protein
MREAPDPRVSFEVALVRVTRPELDTSPAAIVERLERLERGQRSVAPIRDAAPEAPAPPPPPPAPGGSRPALGALRRPAGAPAPAEAPSAPADPAPLTPPPARAPRPEPNLLDTAPRSTAGSPPPPAPSGGSADPPPSAGSGSAEPPAAGFPSRDELALAWGDSILRALKARTKGLYGSGRFVAVEDQHAVFGFESATLAEMANQARPDVEAALAAHFARAVPVKIVVVPADGIGTAAGDPAGGPTAEPEDEVHDLAELTDAPPDDRTPIDHLRSAFPGAELLPQDPE